MPISLRTIVTMAMQRLNGHRRLTGAVTVGVVLSVALMASIAIYDDALDRLGLQFELERVPPQEFDLRIATSSHLLAPDRYGPDQDRIERSLDRLGELIQERTRTATSATFFLAPAGEPLRTDDGRPRSRLQFLTDLDAHVVIDAGRLPSAAVARTDGAPPQVEAALGSEAATALGVQLGDRFDLYPFLARGRGADHRRGRGTDPAAGPHGTLLGTATQSVHRRHQRLGHVCLLCGGKERSAARW